MSETRHLTVHQLQTELASIARSADQLREYAGMYAHVYADDLSEEISLGLRAMAETVLRLAGDHEVAHARDAEFADAVQSTLDRLPTAGPDTHEDWDDWLDDWHKEDDE
jgi:hypothetical protein